MGAVILYIFNFSILFLFCFCKSEEWYRRLPDDKRETSNFIIGVYQKKNQNRAPMNSKIYINDINEKIIFLKNGEFKKEYNQNEVKDLITKSMEINIEGKYLINGNWILLYYLNYNSKITENSIKIEKSNTLNKKLLYYYNDKKKYIIPMVYELGLIEKDFGVKDGVKIPYKEDDPFFLISLKNYSEKEFRTHAFYLDEVNK